MDACESKIADWLNHADEDRILVWQVAKKSLGLEINRLGRVEQKHRYPDARGMRCSARTGGRAMVDAAMFSDRVTDMMFYRSRSLSHQGPSGSRPERGSPLPEIALGAKSFG
jgi:hypothetical protein